MDKTLEKRVFEIVSTVFNLPVCTVTIDTSQKEVPNWDSLNLINLMIALESEFNVELGVEQVVNLVSVKAILRILGEKGVS